MRNLITFCLLAVQLEAFSQDAYGEPFSPTTYWVPNEGQFVDSHGDPMPTKKFVSVGSNPQVVAGTNSLLSLFFTIPDLVNPKRCHITMKPVGETAQLKQPYAAQLAPGTDNYYYPWCMPGITEIKRYYVVRYDDIMPNVHQVVYSTPSGLRMAIVCDPGFNQEDLYFKFSGQDSLRVDIEGALKLYVGDKYIRFEQAVAYQLDDNQEPVSLSWGANWEQANTTGVVSFYFGEYDPDRTVVLQIGPPPMGGGGNENLNEGLDWSTSFGDDNGGNGLGEHMGASVAGPDGSLYITGSHIYGEFPPIPGWVPILDATWDVFLLKHKYAPGDPTQDAAQAYATHIGGAGDDKSKALFMNQASTALYLGGYTKSTDLPTFPPDDPLDGSYWEEDLKGTADGLLMKLDPATGFLQRLAAFGGSGKDMITAFSEDDQGKIWFTGVTDSPTGTEDNCNSPATGFPLCDPAGSNYWQPNNAGGLDAFLTRLDVNFHMTSSTFFGSAADDKAYDLTFTKSTPPLITMVGSTEGTIPQNAFGTFHLAGDGMKGGFIATFTLNSELRWSTNVQKLNSLQNIAERNNNVLVLGYSHHTNYWIYNGGGDEPLNSPAVASCIAVPGAVSICDPGSGAYTDAQALGGDTYVAEFNPVLGTLLWSTFIGDGSEELPAIASYQWAGVAYEFFGFRKYQDLAVDALDNFYVMSTTSKLPVEPSSYPTLPAAPFYYKAIDNTVGDDQSDITLHCFRANRSLYWATIFGAFAPHVPLPPDWDYYYLSDGCDLGASLALVDHEALYWTGTTGNDRFPTQCPYPGTSYCEPFATSNVQNWQGFATRMNLQDINIGLEEVVGSASAISCWPNPVTDVVAFHFQGLPTENGNVRVFDPTGRLVMELPLNNGKTSLGTLAPGYYNAVVLDSHNRLLGTTPLIKTR